MGHLCFNRAESVIGPDLEVFNYEERPVSDEHRKYLQWGWSAFVRDNGKPRRQDEECVFNVRRQIVTPLEERFPNFIAVLSAKAVALDNGQTWMLFGVEEGKIPSISTLVFTMLVDSPIGQLPEELPGDAIIKAFVVQEGRLGVRISASAIGATVLTSEIGASIQHSGVGADVSGSESGVTGHQNE